MTHELKTPLTSIRIYAELLLSGRITDQHKRHRYLSVIVDESHRLTRLINNVLDLSKIEAGKTTLNKENFDLYRLLDDLQDMFQMAADDKRLQLLFDRCPNLHISQAPTYANSYHFHGLTGLMVQV